MLQLVAFSAVFSTVHCSCSCFYFCSGDKGSYCSRVGGVACCRVLLLYCWRVFSFRSFFFRCVCHSARKVAATSLICLIISLASSKRSMVSISDCIISTGLMKGSICWTVILVKRYLMTASVWEVRLGVSKLLGVNLGLAINVWYDAWILYLTIGTQMLLPFVKEQYDVTHKCGVV